MDDGQSLVAEASEKRPRHLLTVDDFHRMGEAGIFGPTDRVELIEGELVDIAPIGSGHAGCVSALNELLMLAIRGCATLYTQSPVRLNDRCEPQPDFAVLKSRPDHYRSALPTPADVLLLIEVADSSLKFDRSAKLPLYARHGIPEFWIVNLIDRQIEVYRDPQGDNYASSAQVRPGQPLEIAALPGASILAAPVLGVEV